MVRPIEALRDIAVARRYDLVVVYRKTYPGALSRLLRRNARRIVYEYDDAVYMPSPAEPQGPNVEARYRRNFMTTINIADHLVAGNAVLAAAVGSRPRSVLPTAVDLRVFRVSDRPAEAGDCVLGWIGTAENFPQWEQLIPVYRQVIARHPNLRFKIVSDVEPVPCGLPVDFERFTIDREAECLQDFDVGLMPLQDTVWNRGKCGIKALQCMAIGRPVVISPVGMNSELIEPDVSGLFASSEAEWISALDRLADSPRLRRQMGGEARKAVEASYSLEVIGPRMVDLLERVGES
jgi:glycosyltransferase involved in cell wall biosynthesis